MTYSIWLEPVTHDATYLRKIIQNISLEYHAPMFSPHVTLYSGIERLADAKNAMTNCKVSRMRLRCTSIGHSSYLWKTIFINVKNGQKLKTLNRTLRENLKNEYEFKPHISLVYKKLDAKTRKKIINGLKTRSTITFDKISIIKSLAGKKKKEMEKIKKLKQKRKSISKNLGSEKIKIKKMTKNL
jgi:2'-5' RNA ligase